MDWLKRIASDVSGGRNLEVYLTILFASVVFALNVFNVVSLDVIAASILGVLALLALSILNNRERMTALQRETAVLSKLVDEKVVGNVRAEAFFLSKTPDLEDEFSTAQKIDIAGTTLNQTVQNYQGVFGERLRAKATIRLIIIKPESRAAQQAARRSYKVRQGQIVDDLIRPTLNLVESLATDPTVSGKLELSLLPFVPSFGLTLIDPDRTDGRIYVEIYQHRSAARQPTFVLDRTRDPKWYGFFQRQFDLLWEVAEPYSFEDNDSSDP